MTGISVAEEKCMGCSLCVKACKLNAIKMEQKKAHILEDCTLCGACMSVCRYNAIKLCKEEQEGFFDIASYSGIWVFGEHVNGNPKEVVLELLGEGRKLADQLQVELSVVLLGYNIDQAARLMISYGADKVYMIDCIELNDYNDQLYTDVFVQIIERFKPEAVLMGATTYGRSLAPRAASRLNTGLTADCTCLEVDSDRRLLLQTRPAYGGNLMATIICPNHRPQMATVRPKVMKKAKQDGTRTGQIIRPEVVVPRNVNVKLLEVISDIDEKVSLAEADVIVSIGRGIGGQQNIKAAEELARLLGGALGASRAVVDAGWLDYSHQIGQTGRTVSPKVYIACGISGAIQHLAGILSSERIIAIDKNPEAPIFKVANIGIVGDLKEVLPAIISELKARRA